MAFYTRKTHGAGRETLAAGLLMVASLLLGGLDFTGAEASARPIRPIAPEVTAGVVRSGSSAAQNPRIRYPYAAPADAAFGDVTPGQAKPSQPKGGGGEGPRVTGDPRFAPEITGAPYEALGIWYAPTAEPDYDETGTASYYGEGFHGKPTASGEIFDSTGITAAHPTLPIPSLVQVTNLANGREMVVRVNDRGPFVGGRIIDLSAGAAQILGFAGSGTTEVRVRYLGPAPTRLITPQIAPRVASAPEPETRSVPDPALVPETATLTPEKSGPRWRLQLASFSDLSNARAYGRQMASKLGAEWGRVEFEAAVVNGVDVFRVLVGAWKDREGALEAGNAATRLLGAPVAVIHRPS